MTAPENLYLQAALAAARRGWKVFPCWGIEDGKCACPEKEACEHPGKHPIARHAPNGLKDATGDAQTIRLWWTLTPNANPAMRTGRESGVTVVDVDGDTGEVTITMLCGQHGGVPATYRVKTGKGFHLYFKFCERLRTGNNALGEKVDVKNDNGYVMLPPSAHISGNTYTLVSDVALLDVPEWMEPPQRGRGRPKGSVKNSSSHLTLEQISSALGHIDPDDRDRWRNVGVILGRTFSNTPAENDAREMYYAWARKSPKYDDDPAGNEDHMRACFSEWSQEQPRGGEPLKMGSLIAWAREGGWEFEGAGVEHYEDFYAVGPANKYLYVPTGALWPSESVNAILPPRVVARDDWGEPIFQKASEWLMKNRVVHSLVFDPALAPLTENHVAKSQGVEYHKGATLYNRYQPPGRSARVRGVGRRDRWGLALVDHGLRSARNAQRAPWDSPRRSPATERRADGNRTMSTLLRHRGASGACSLYPGKKINSPEEEKRIYLFWLEV